MTSHLLLGNQIGGAWYSVTGVQGHKNIELKGGDDLVGDSGASSFPREFALGPRGAHIVNLAYVRLNCLCLGTYS